MMWLRNLANAIRKEAEYQLIIRKHGWGDTWYHRRWWRFGPEPYCGVGIPWTRFELERCPLNIWTWRGPEWEDGVLVNSSPFFKDGKFKTREQWVHEVTDGRGFVESLYLAR